MKCASSSWLLHFFLSNKLTRNYQEYLSSAPQQGNTFQENTNREFYTKRIVTLEDTHSLAKAAFILNMREEISPTVNTKRIGFDL